MAPAIVSATGIENSKRFALSFIDAQTSFVYDPYPIGLVRPVFPPAVYAELVRNWPPPELFVYKASLGHKYSLSEVNNPEDYIHFLRSCRVWGEVYENVKHPGFVTGTLELLKEHHIDLGLHGRRVSRIHALSSWSERFRALGEKLKRLHARDSSLSARFEFSMLPADGGCIKPHTDAPQKLVTLVFSMVGEGEWEQSFGGGTSMLKPKDLSRNYNQLNRQLEFDEAETIHTFPFEPNQCLIFVKTFNSLHAVAPMTGLNSKAMRKTLTINIECW